jgi:DNA-binding CsgD family transcriptional regulator
MAALDRDDLTLLFKLSKSGKTLDELCEALDADVETVLTALAQKLEITPRQMKRISTLRKQGDSLQQISEHCSISLASLLKVFPNLPSDLTNQILNLARQGLSSEDISHSTGIAETDVIIVLNSVRPPPQSRGPASVASSERTTSSASSVGTFSSVNTKSTVQEEVRIDTNAIVPSRSSHRRRWPNGDSYRGQLLHDKPHGQGTMKYRGNERMIYVGEWVNGVKHGHGELTWPSGATYEGEWKNDKSHGHGTEKFSDGSVFTGTWSNDKIVGGGVHIRPTGERYEGEYENHKKNGQGTMNWADGVVYTGSWKDDQMHGPGVEVEVDGGRYTGTWSEGKKHGDFTYSKGGSSRREKWSAGVLRK